MGFSCVSGVGGEFEFCGELGCGWGGVWWEIVCGDGGGGGVVCLRYGWGTSIDYGSRGHVTSCENWLRKVEVCSRATIQGY